MLQIMFFTKTRPSSIQFTVFSYKDNGVPHRALFSDLQHSNATYRPTRRKNKPAHTHELFIYVNNDQ